jgi:hypothetical protein
MRGRNKISLMRFVNAAPQFLDDRPIPTSAKALSPMIRGIIRARMTPFHRAISHCFSHIIYGTF